MPDTDVEVHKIPQHRHCRRCGKAFVGEGIKGHYCCQDCFDKDGSEAKAKLKKYALIIVVLWVVVAVAVIVVGF